MTDNTKITIADMRNSEVDENLSVVTDGLGGYTHVLISGGATASGGASYLDDLLDVVVDSPPTVTDNEVLAFNSGSDKWINQTAGEAGLSIVGHTHDHAVLTNVSINQHHNKQHDIEGTADHMLTGSVSGYFMQAHSDTTFGFSPFLVQDLPSHTHTEAQITDLEHDAIKLQGTAVSAATPASGQILKYDGSEWLPGSASGIGATAFTQLDDTPSSYLGQGGKYVAVNSGANALEFITAPVSSGVGSNITVHHCTVTRTSTNSFVNDWTIVWTNNPEDDENMWDSSTRVYSYWNGWVVVTAQAGFTAGGGSGDWRTMLLKSGGIVAYHGDHCSDWNVQNGHMITSIGYTGPVTSGSYFTVSLGNYSGSGKTNSSLCALEVTVIEA